VGDIRKFSEYALINDKAPKFAKAGYSTGDAQALLDLYLSQAREKFAAGEYTEIDPTPHGRRFTIVIDLPGKGPASGRVFHFKSGWIIEGDGKLKLSTPFSGEVN
jgi:filamentous hemagglutinin